MCNRRVLAETAEPGALEPESGFCMSGFVTAAVREEQQGQFKLMVSFTVRAATKSRVWGRGKEGEGGVDDPSSMRPDVDLGAHVSRLGDMRVGAGGIPCLVETREMLAGGGQGSGVL